MNPGMPSSASSSSPVPVPDRVLMLRERSLPAKFAVSDSAASGSRCVQAAATLPVLSAGTNSNSLAGGIGTPSETIDRPALSGPWQEESASRGAVFNNPRGGAVFNDPHEKDGAVSSPSSKSLRTMPGPVRREDRHAVSSLKRAKSFGSNRHEKKLSLIHI